MDLILQTIILSGLMTTFLFYIWRRSSSSKDVRKQAPVAPGGWPLIGHLPLFLAPRHLFEALGDIADKLGPAFTIRNGTKSTTLVISSSELAKECFTSNDQTLSCRPSTSKGKYLGYNFALVGMAPYGPYWRNARRISIVHLLSNSMIAKHQQVPINEISKFLKELHSSSKQMVGKGAQAQVDMRELLNRLAFRIMVKLVIGKHISESDPMFLRLQDAVFRFMYIFDVFVPSDFFPLPEWIDWKGRIRGMKSIAKELDSIMGLLVEEHRKKQTSKDDDDEQRNTDQEDFIDALISSVEEDDFYGHNVDATIKAIALTMIIGGSFTTSTTLVDALSLLLANPHTITEAQNELDAKVGKQRRVEETDIKHLDYIKAIINESLRLVSPGLSNITREATEDCEIGGFFVPAGTHVMINAWKMHRDHNLWEDSLCFKPERFLGNEVSIGSGQQFELIPFGAGRRSCPGAAFALHALQLSLASVLHGFELAPASGDLNSGEAMMIVCPRLDPCLY